MQAFVIHQFGGPEVLQYQPLPVPELKPGEVLVKTAAAGINPIDWKTCSGGGASAFIGNLPFVPGWEFSGTIVNGNGTRWQADDRVFGMIRFPEPAGCYAEYIAVPADQIARVPDIVELEEAGGLATASLTAWQALFDKGQLKAGQCVLILGAAGGVGHLAVQLAKWAGAHVLGTASMHNHEFLGDLGVDRVIDYQHKRVPEHAKDIDLIIDCVGGESGIEALECLKPDGRLVTLPSVTKDIVAAAGQAQNRHVEAIRVMPDAAQLEQIIALYADDILRLQLNDSYRPDQLEEAFELSATGHVCGKLILSFA